MNAYERATILYDKFPGVSGSLEEDLLWHSRHAYAHVTPEYVILARADREGDCWHIFLAVGKGCMAEFFRLAPFPLAYVSFDRPASGKKFKFNYHRMKRLCDRNTTLRKC